MHHEIINNNTPAPTKATLHQENIRACHQNGHDTSLSNTNEITESISTEAREIEPQVVASGDSAATWKASSRRCSSDGALKAMQAAAGQKPERGHSFSDSDEKTAALKARIHAKYEELDKEMAAMASANGLVLNGRTSPTPRAVLELDGHTAELLSPDPRMVPPEDTCVFTTAGPAGVLCELKTTPDSLPGRNTLMAEVKELAYSRLQQELRKAQLELKLKDEEVARLSQIRDDVGSELEELTASLFEEANNMVREANVKQAYAEKLLKEANLKIEVLQAEVQALKTLVITSTPSMPNPHLHPQIDNKRPHNGGVRSLFSPGHKRSPSNYELCSFKDTPPGSPTKEASMPNNTDFSPDNYEVDPVFHQEFLEWHQSPTLDKTNPFLDNIYREDILPCLNFTNKNLSSSVLTAIENNAITIEQVNGKNPFPKRCSLLEAPRLCKYRMKLGEDPEWHYISHLCRNRIAAVCDFFCYIRYIQQGLVKSGVHEVYWEVIRKRRDVSLARLGILSL